MPRLPKKSPSVPDLLAPLSAELENFDAVAILVEPSGRAVLTTSNGVIVKPGTLDPRDVARAAQAIRAQVGAPQGSGAGPLGEGAHAVVAPTLDGDAIRVSRRRESLTFDAFEADGSIDPKVAEVLRRAVASRASVVVASGDPAQSSELLEALGRLEARSIALFVPCAAVIPAAMRFGPGQVADAVALGADVLVAESPSAPLLAAILASGRPFFVTVEAGSARAALRAMVARIALDRPGVDCGAIEGLVESAVDVFVEVGARRRARQLLEPSRDEGRVTLRTLVRETENGVESRMSGSKLDVRLSDDAFEEPPEVSARRGLDMSSGLGAVDDAPEGSMVGPIGQVGAGELERIRAEELVSKSFLVDVGGFTRSAEGKSSLFQPGLLLDREEDEEEEESSGLSVSEAVDALADADVAETADGIGWDDADGTDGGPLEASSKVARVEAPKARSVPVARVSEAFDEVDLGEVDDVKDHAASGDESSIENESLRERAFGDPAETFDEDEDQAEDEDEEDQDEGPIAGRPPSPLVRPVMRTTTPRPASQVLDESDDWSDLEDESAEGTGVSEAPDLSAHSDVELADADGDEESPDWGDAAESEETVGNEKDELVQPRARPMLRPAPERMPTDVLRDQPGIGGPAGLPRSGAIPWDEEKTGHAVDPSEATVMGAPGSLLPKREDPRPRVRTVDLLMTTEGDVVPTGTTRESVPDLEGDDFDEIAEHDLVETGSVEPRSIEASKDEEDDSAPFEEHTPLLADPVGKPLGKPVSQGFEEPENTMHLPDDDDSMSGSKVSARPTPSPGPAPRARPRPSPSRVGRALSRFRRK
ncbi:MAG: hypothetical protein HYV07_01475 [Deltaproteobacteria bacterium]|nr:hypothetical protein [Deltaproteobacteria bacterium]